MGESREMILEEMKRRLGELKDEAARDGSAAEYRVPEKDRQRRMHYSGPRQDVNTMGTFQDDDFALLANFKRYRAASINIENEDMRNMYGKLLDAASRVYACYAGLKQVEKEARLLADGDEAAKSQSFQVRAQALLLETVESGKEAKRAVQALERFFRLVASKRMEDDEETFEYRLRSEEDFPESSRRFLKKFGVDWDEAVSVGKRLHDQPPVLTKALFVVDGFSEEDAKPFLDQKGTDADFHVEDPYAVAFAVSNFDNAMQPLFSAAQVRILREQRKSMYDMIFVDGTSAKELYGPKISRDQDAKQRGNEMKMRIFADLLQGRHMEVSNGEKFLPVFLRVDLDGLKETVQERELAILWSEERIQDMVDEERRNLTMWMEQLEDKMWGVIGDAVEEHPDGIDDEEEIQKWLDGLLEIDEF